MRIQTQIQIDQLSLVKDAKTFFEMDKFLLVDVVDITDAPIATRMEARKTKEAFYYRDRLYLPIILRGSPENLFLKAKNGIAFVIGDYTAYAFFDGGLNDLLAKNKVYDISDFYRIKDIAFNADNEFLIDRYILPYNEKQITLKIIYPL